MGCFYCDEHHEGREAIMYKVGEMEAGVLYLFKDQAHKGRCALALKNHRKELCECGPEELAAFARDLARASGAVKELWGCDKINLGSFGDTNPHLHFHIVPKYEGGLEFGGSFAITNPEPVLLSVWLREDFLVDVALVFALLSFLAVVVVSRLVAARRRKRPEREKTGGNAHDR